MRDGFGQDVPILPTKTLTDQSMARPQERCIFHAAFWMPFIVVGATTHRSLLFGKLRYYLRFEAFPDVKFYSFPAFWRVYPESRIFARYPVLGRFRSIELSLCSVAMVGGNGFEPLTLSV